MNKGKFGFSIWLYPFISLWTVLVGPPLGSLAILLFVIVVEQDEWAIKQCIQALMFSFYWAVYDTIMTLLEAIPLFGWGVLVIDFVIWVVLVIVIFVVGLSRLKHGGDMWLPGRGIANKVFGYVNNYTDGFRGKQQYDNSQQYEQQYQPNQQQNQQQYNVQPNQQQQGNYQQPYQNPQGEQNPQGQSRNNGFVPPPPPPRN